MTEVMNKVKTKSLVSVLMITLALGLTAIIGYSLWQSSSAGLPATAVATPRLVCNQGQQIGDLNNDKKIDAVDVKMMADVIVRKILPPLDYCCIDLNKDGRINSADTGIIVKITKNEIQSPGFCPYLSMGMTDPGCYIKFGSDYHRVSDNKELCEDIFIASYFINLSDSDEFTKKDFYLLLKSLGQNFTEDFVTSRSANVFYYQGGKSVPDDFRSLAGTFSASTCTTINYFGVNLFCFNEVTGSNPKKSNLKMAIRDFTFLKYTDQNTWNPLKNALVRPYTFTVDSGITFFDASTPSAYGMTLEDVKCTEYIARAHYNRDNNGVYLCSSFFEAERKNYRNASILYHEVNHKYDNLSSNNKMGHITCSLDCPIKEGDLNWVSVYGAHIEYLKTVSQNVLFGDDVRCGAYNFLMREFDTKLCHCPTAPRILAPLPPNCKSTYTPITYSCSSACNLKSKTTEESY